MYVCFGFSLACLRRARTIDLQCQSLCLCRAFLLRSVCLSCMSVSRALARLRRARTVDLQCQSLSLRRAFLLRSVCLSVRLTVESRAVCWPTRSQNQSNITAKIDRKSITGDASGHPKSTQNRFRDPLGTPRGVQERPEGVSGASRERPGASPARSGSARRVTKSAPGRQKGRPGAPGSAPSRPKSTPSRVREQKIRVVLARFTRRPIFGRFSPDFRSIFGCSRKAFGERSRGELRSIFGSSTRSLTLTKHCP